MRSVRTLDRLLPKSSYRARTHPRDSADGITRELRARAARSGSAAPTAGCRDGDERRALIRRAGEAIICRQAAGRGALACSPEMQPRMIRFDGINQRRGAGAD